MNVALFGGTFDPIHRGHLAVARAAMERYALGKVLFVPANIQPLKKHAPVTAYIHRYAMVSLAVAGEKKFVPSLLEAPDPREPSHPSYTIDTVRALRRSLRKSDRLFILLGIDAFIQIAKWRESEALLRGCEFIVANRPGFSMAHVARALPDSMRPEAMVTQLFRKQKPSGDLAIGGAMIHLLEEVQDPSSGTKIRITAAKGGNLGKVVGESVAEYIRKVGLYRAKAEPEDEEGSEAKPKLEIVGGKAHKKGSEPARHSKRS
jgi:nicotinate-nucleotide adenylyltransferase